MIVSAFSDRVRSFDAALGRETRRIADAVRPSRLTLTRSLDLTGLAALANVSKYHFLRIFRPRDPLTPYQYLLTARMRRAAVGLAGSSDSVLSIALDSRYGDLSTFNASLS